MAKTVEVVLAVWVRAYAKVVVQDAASEAEAFEVAKTQARKHHPTVEWQVEAPDPAKVTIYAFRELGDDQKKK